MSRVLVIDDDDATSFRVIARLVTDGHTVLHVRSSDRALEVDRVDLIVADFQTAGRSALELVRIMRAGGRPTPAVIISSFADPALADAVNLLGARLLLKPFALERLSELASASLGAAS
jgi:CheY-like chemotaxis protein